jgi:hypothetical protein
MQLVDVRDLAEWLIRTAVEGTTGVVSATAETTILAHHLEMARRVAGHTATVVQAPARRAGLSDADERELLSELRNV